MTGVEYDAAIGALTAPVPVIGALVQAVRDVDAPMPPELEAVGALDGLTPALAPVAAPRCQLRLERGGRVGQGWVDAERATFVVPLPDGRARLRSVPSEFTPDALARLNELGPRHADEDAEPITLTAGELAGRIADWRGLREHWRVVATWPPAGARVVEVVDTDGGLWLVAASGERRELHPISPSGVFLLLCGLLPDDGELAGPAD